MGSKSSQNASIFHEKNDGGVKFFIGYPYTAGYGGIQEYWCLYVRPVVDHNQCLCCFLSIAHLDSGVHISKCWDLI